MSEYRNFAPDRNDLPADVSLLLRTHSEQRWLSREVIPVVRQIETGERLPEEQLPAAAAYLEVIWLEALRRARDSDAALSELDAHHPPPEALLFRARRYYAAVRTLRDAVAGRVAPLIAAPAQAPERADSFDLIR